MKLKEIKNVLSCFDGISAVQQALVNGNIKYDNYYSSEIDKDSIIVTQKNFPNTIQLGDIRNLNGKLLKNINLLTAGSPCTDFSNMGKKRGMKTTDNIIIESLDQYLDLKNKGFNFVGQSYLFWEYVRLKREIDPTYFLVENVIMKDMWKDIFTKELGVEPIRINSSLVSAQNRDRYYWTNIPNLSVPTDKGILLSDIIPGAIGAAKRGVYSKKEGRYVYPLQLRKDGKANCLVTNPYTTNRFINTYGDYNVIPPEVAETLQTIPVGYTDVLSKYKRYRALGNSMTVDVIGHIISNI
jgi:site-specific DNA-cytosine methylase